jgi:hypothetical protein
MISDLSGGKFDVHAEEILASNGRIHRKMVDVFQQAPRKAE